MDDNEKSREELIEELDVLRERLRRLETPPRVAAAADTSPDVDWLRLLSERLPAVLWTTDRRLRFTASFGSGLAHIGSYPHAVVGMDLYEYFETTDPAHPMIAAHRHALDGESVGDTVDHRARHFEVYVEPLTGSDGRIVGTIGIALDVTERAVAEDARRQAATLVERHVSERTGQLVRYNMKLQREVAARKGTERELSELADQVQQQARTLDAIISASPDHFYIHDRAGKYTYVSRSGARALGLPREHMVGRTWAELGLPARVGGRFDAQREVVFATGRTVTDEVEITTTDGARSYEYALEAMRDSDGEVEAVLCIFRDITERRDIERMLAESNRSLARARDELEERVQTAYSALNACHDLVTHHLSNHAMTSLGLVERVLDRADGDLAERDRKLLLKVRRQACELTRLAANAKMLVALTDKGLPKATLPVRLVDVLRDSVQLIRSTHYDATFFVSTECADELSVPGLPFLEYILTNLLDYAVRHSPPSSTPVIRVRVSTEGPDDDVRLSFLGNLPSHVPSLDELFQSHDGDQGVEPAELSLALVREVAERSGGQLRATTLSEGGEEQFAVTISLPRSEAWRAS